ncbi:Glyoxalase/bleomycin resistance protein/dioxygenase [Natrinema pellirubrum DSM 15624]|uniref:Glyoxalase/bleomycin resistance protein/dioxygenase n=1 Tax=Natrinema pellirubrum (strain DSM 15624 / CIP 106293 / JCM 10476 / NCIMB 786 / 157) TaxID=797303 RepID=L0JPL4_NATP1|nr:VOC family protein [Natrinema pellirubrum]AGB33179.1 lactoylglutathione lyase-like lyase [Natrinema pellirubrum DSM 15624]ELY71844.1 Glyoxalase/bleomycin resistance protein/dioxygenase [Natrinema pellirubrum DSM 15624]
MLTDTAGLHHVTGIVGDAQSAIDFYGGVLGLRLVTQTVNFEDVLQHHLYFGDAAGRPGTVLTHFADPHGDPGRFGAPQPESVAFVVPDGSLAYRADRLAERGVALEGPLERFDERVLRFADPAGTRLELVAGPPVPGDVEPWTEGPIPTDHAIRGLHGVATLSVNPYGTAGALETLGFEHEAEDGDRIRYRASGSRAAVVDVLDRDAAFGREGQGTLHHVAVRVESEDALHEWRDLFDERGHDVSRVKDRHVFHSLYVREPGGILLELATETDGVAASGPTGGPGESLYLPAWFERDRELIESQLPELTVPNGNGDDESGDSPTDR